MRFHDMAERYHYLFDRDPADNSTIGLQLTK